MDELLQSRGTKRPASESGSHDLHRFVAKQREDHALALRELQNGCKRSCWSWWIFPTPPFIRNGRRVGSGLNLVYEIKDDTEGLAYIAHRLLRANYLEIVNAMNGALEAGVRPTRLLGIDVPRAESSVRYFEKLSFLGDGDKELGAVCHRALELLRPPSGGAATSSKPKIASAPPAPPAPSAPPALEAALASSTKSVDAAAAVADEAAAGGGAGLGDREGRDGVGDEGTDQVSPARGAGETGEDPLRLAVRAAVREQTAADGAVSIKHVRHHCEAALGLPADGLKKRKSELVMMVNEVIDSEGPSSPAQDQEPPAALPTHG